MDNKSEVFTAYDADRTHVYKRYVDLTSVIIPDSVTEIGFGAFRGCEKLTSVVISDGVTEIRDYAFEGCPCEASLPDKFKKMMEENK